ncbi:hypothetical protein AVEN_122887-1 [Araneus ventricosus]|uniref:Uncharacterized protein n=1 Tax=Araneus ventricosus TaxID=182803 RepID=A0A4Y2UUC0_ARAVE|nr:hypothetical protein AVEN_122887-1 [Araneus ventricosus]
MHWQTDAQQSSFGSGNLLFRFRLTSLCSVCQDVVEESCRAGVACLTTIVSGQAIHVTDTLSASSANAYIFSSNWSILPGSRRSLLSSTAQWEKGQLLNPATKIGKNSINLHQ